MKTHYDGDFDVLVLRGQLQLMKSEFKLRDDDLRDGELWTWRDVVEYVKELRGPQKQLLSEVVKLIRLLLLIPATNAVSEWSASAVRRTKTYVRSTMGQARLNHAMLLTIHREQTDKLNIVEIANQFVNNENRLRNFGRFTKKDMRSYAPVKSKQKYTQTDLKVESDL